MSYFKSYTDPYKVTTINESKEFFIKNLKDAFTASAKGDFNRVREKFSKVIDAFLTYYTLGDRQLDAISDAIQERIKGGHLYQPLDIPKYDDCMRLMDRNWDLEGEDVLLKYKERLIKDGNTSRDDLFLFYLVLSKIKDINLEYFRDYMSKYFLPIYVDKKYICWIVFDEVAVHKVLILCSDNQYDIMGKMKSVPLKVKGSIFRK